MLDRQVDWFVNRDGRFELMLPAADGVLRSSVFPGLWLDPAALVGDDKVRVKAILEQGLNSPEHADFVARLAQGPQRLISGKVAREPLFPTRSL